MRTSRPRSRVSPSSLPHATRRSACTVIASDGGPQAIVSARHVHRQVRGRSLGRLHVPGGDGIEGARNGRSPLGRWKPRLHEWMRLMSSTSTRSRRGRDEQILHVARHLTERDHHLLDLIAEHRVFTTEQVCDLVFDNLTTARHRLTKLCELRLLDRFAPFRTTGSAPYHYVLGELGAYVIAAHRGIEFKAIRWRPERMLALARSSHLAHLVGVNGFFASLSGAAREMPGASLLRWWSEARCAERFGEVFARWLRRVDRGRRDRLLLPRVRPPHRGPGAPSGEGGPLPEPSGGIGARVGPERCCAVLLRLTAP
jgi:hypothetical protein